MSEKYVEIIIKEVGLLIVAIALVCVGCFLTDSRNYEYAAYCLLAGTALAALWGVDKFCGGLSLRERSIVFLVVFILLQALTIWILKEPIGEFITDNIWWIILAAGGGVVIAAMMAGDTNATGRYGYRPPRRL